VKGEISCSDNFHVCVPSLVFFISEICYRFMRQEQIHMGGDC
jgi:hypothetical protein